ncbi:MAG: prepilin-type N-terminal cleavage/methylation domain-containing protein [Firmicutes bacterium]|nr:prepilin-type N-terminal cleavage/methylation domain-containing protein [Bacillota bacterium]
MVPGLFSDVKSYGNNMKTQPGFTLIELVLTICILGFLVSIVIPNFKGTLEDYRLKNAAMEIASEIRLIQQRAISEGDIFKIIFDLNNRDRYHVARGTRILKTAYLPDGVILEGTSLGGGHQIVFTESGAPVPAGSITLKNKRGERRYVIVAVATGRVRISENPPD